MQQKYIKAFNALKKLGVPVYEHADDNGNFSISAEEPESHKWCSYYASHDQWGGEDTNPTMDKTLRKHGLFAEWINPGRMAVFVI